MRVNIGTAADWPIKKAQTEAQLQDVGPQRVGLPHIRPLEGKLWEMRMQGRDGIARAALETARKRS